MWHIFMKHTYKDTHREPCIVLLRWGISMMKQNLKQTMMMMMKCFDYDLMKMMIKQTVLLMTMFRYGAVNDEYDNLNDDNIDYFVCVILSFSRYV